MMQNARVKDHMKLFPFTVGPEQGLSEALHLMKTNSIRHLPVINKDQEVVGVLSEREAKRLQVFDSETMIFVGDAMVENPYIVRQGTPLREVLEVMYQKKYGCVVVVSLNRQILGIFTTTDAVRILASLIDDDGQVLRASKPIRAIEEYLSYGFAV